MRELVIVVPPTNSIQPEEMVANLKAQKKIFHHRIVNSRNNESLDKAVASFEEAYEKDTLGELAEKEIELSNSSDNPGQVEEMRLRLQKASDIRGVSLGESTQSSLASIIPTHLQTLLPRLQLPKFGGKHQELDSFWAIFKAGFDEQPVVRW
ncbi:hypothetical protein GCK32_006943 [Trichostrongylus colubriformis]|uniref:Uncharacterized protein n=1 Tax=Trichostrongylus colubriformis TaxID=6319 RepID=A0AAN8IIK6_TRICO